MEEHSCMHRLRESTSFTVLTKLIFWTLYADIGGKEPYVDKRWSGLLEMRNRIWTCPASARPITKSRTITKAYPMDQKHWLPLQWVWWMVRQLAISVFGYCWFQVGCSTSPIETGRKIRTVYGSTISLCICTCHQTIELLWGISAFIVALSVSLNDKIVNYQTNTFHQVDRLSIYYFHSFNDPASFVPKLENYREIFDRKETLIPIESSF